MPITETDIRQWADRHECRSNLPVLIRRLIRETAPSVSSLRFPGNESVDLAGLDGQVETEASTPWVPQGRSIWEMGCNQNPKTKADGDYAKRTAETPQEERKTDSFLFITPRRWKGKEEWLTQRRCENSWAAVYAGGGTGNLSLAWRIAWEGSPRLDDAARMVATLGDGCCPSNINAASCDSSA